MAKHNCSIRDVAKFVGVAPGTVSRVLNNRMGNLRVSDETRQLILAGAKELNYTPNINARRLFSRKSEVVALVLPSYQTLGKHVFHDHHLAAIFSGIEDALHGLNYNLLMVFNDEYFVHDKKYLNLFKEGAVDGIMVWGASPVDTFWRESTQLGVPLLFIDTPPGPDKDFHFVAHDYASAGFMACKYLREIGCRRQVFIGGHPGSFTNRAVECGLEEARNCFPDVELVSFHGDYRSKQAEAVMAAYQGVCDAVIGININTALGAIRAIEARKLTVPGDIQVISCDSAEGEDVNGITTMRVDDQKLGFHAVHRLLEMIADPAVSPRERLPVSLQLGSSTQPREVACVPESV